MGVSKWALKELYLAIRVSGLASCLSMDREIECPSCLIHQRSASSYPTFFFLKNKINIFFPLNVTELASVEVRSVTTTTMPNPYIIPYSQRSTLSQTDSQLLSEIDTRLAYRIGWPKPLPVLPRSLCSIYDECRYIPDAEDARKKE